MKKSFTFLTIAILASTSVVTAGFHNPDELLQDLQGEKSIFTARAKEIEQKVSTKKTRKEAVGMLQKLQETVEVYGNALGKFNKAQELFQSRGEQPERVEEISSGFATWRGRKLVGKAQNWVKIPDLQQLNKAWNEWNDIGINYKKANNEVLKAKRGVIYAERICEEMFGQLNTTDTFKVDLTTRGREEEVMQVIGGLNLIHTGKPTSVKVEKEKATITTDCNRFASYQLRSDPFEVEEGATLILPYTVTVQPGGRMSLGWLNTKEKGWYGKEEVLANTESKPQSFSSTYERVVPKGETQTALVFRNYHIENPGQSTFSIDSLSFQYKPAKPLRMIWSGIELLNTGKTEKIEEGNNGEIIVTTDNNAKASYQLRSLPQDVKEGEKLTISYQITIAPEGRMSLGWLNTEEKGWYGKEEILTNTESKPQSFSSTYERIVPKGETLTSLVFRNYYLKPPGGQTKFTIEKLDFKKTTP